MAAPHSKLAMLAEMASTGSADARRKVLRDIADSFRPENHVLKDVACADLDKILAAIACELTITIRTELSRYIAASPISFNNTARNLAFDEIVVARPVLERSNALTDADLLDVIAQKSQDHMMAVTKRPTISEQVSGALVERGEDDVVASLLDNNGAKIDYPTYEKVAARAESSVVLQEAFVQRSTVPLDLLNDLYFKVEDNLRRDVLKRFSNASSQDLAVAMALSRRRWLVKHGGLPKDYETARLKVDELARRGDLKPPILARLLRDHQQTEFKFAFAKLTATDYELINRLVESQNLDGIAILARAAGFDRALFVTIAIMLSGTNERMAGAESFGKQYEAVSAEYALSVIQLWRLGPQGKPSRAA
ncbi:MAG TPA: DUF2336 domain-containing protein [Micropepsaceae bacterium]|nr:DUF2336 domain-containing protein [Micropepsaceae bacterium]